MRVRFLPLDPTHEYTGVKPRKEGSPVLNRRKLSGLLAALGLSHLHGTEAKRKKRKKKKGPKGSSGPSAPGTTSPPTNPCQGQPNNSGCNGVGRCLNGSCNQPPTCKTISDSLFGNPCGASPECCSGFCHNNGVCSVSQAGQACRIEDDCGNVGGGSCIGYRCT